MCIMRNDEYKQKNIISSVSCFASATSFDEGQVIQ